MNSKKNAHQFTIAYRSIAFICLYILIIFTPFENLLAYYYGQNIKLITVIVITVLVACVVTCAIKSRRVFLIDLILATFTFLSISVSLIRGIPLTIVIKQMYALLATYSVFVAIRIFKLSLLQLQSISFSIQAIIKILSLGALIEIISSKQYLFPTVIAKRFSQSNFERAYSLLLNPNIFAAYIVLGLTLCIYLMYKYNIRLSSTCIVLSLSSLILSQSRSATLLAFFVVIYLMYMYFSRKYKMRIDSSIQVDFTPTAMNSAIVIRCGIILVSVILVILFTRIAQNTYAYYFLDQHSAYSETTNLNVKNEDHDKEDKTIEQTFNADNKDSSFRKYR